MTRLLIVGSSILAQEPLGDDGDNILSSDAIYPKSVMEGWHIVDAVVPQGFMPWLYEWSGSSVMLKNAQPSGPSYSEQRTIYLNEVRSMRAQVLARLNGYGATLYLKDPPAQDVEKANCYMLIQGLLDITTIPEVLAATNIADLTTAVKTEYARLVGLASTELVKAFRQVDV